MSNVFANKKARFKKLSLAEMILLAISCFGVFISFEWSFFNMLVKRKDTSSGSNTNKARFKQMRINHPRHEFESKYEGGKDWCRKQSMADHYIKSDDGLILHASMLKSVDARRIVILCHGYRGSGFGDFANIAKYLHDNNCDLVFIDQRSCGKSEGEYITFGAKEHKDIVKWANYFDKRNGNQLPVYLFGTSMGGASLIMASGDEMPASVRGYIIDCAFHSMKKQIMQMSGNWFNIHHIRVLLFRMDILCRIFAGFKMSDADTKNALAINRKPMLFIHGAMDTFVAPENVLINYGMCKAPKQLLIVDDARHLCSAYCDEPNYRNKIMAFFEKYDKI